MHGAETLGEAGQQGRLEGAAVGKVLAAEQAPHQRIGVQPSLVVVVGLEIQKFLQHSQTEDFAVVHVGWRSASPDEFAAFAGDSGMAWAKASSSAQ